MSPYGLERDIAPATIDERVEKSSVNFMENAGSILLRAGEFDGGYYEHGVLQVAAIAEGRPAPHRVATLPNKFLLDAL